MTRELKIKGMSCGHCVMHVTNALSEVEGVSQVQVDLEGAKATMQVADKVTNDQLKAAVSEAGYEVTEVL